MEKHQRLSLDERETIGQMLSQGKSLRFIADSLSRNVSTISREIRLFSARGTRYKPWLAHYCADYLSARHNTGRRISRNPKLHSFINSHLKLYHNIFLKCLFQKYPEKNKKYCLDTNQKWCKPVCSQNSQ